MESPDLNPAPSRGADDNVVEAWLRRPPVPIADAGFSTRVLASLPPPRRDLPVFRTIVCSAGLIAGTALAWRRTSELDPLAPAWSGRWSELQSAAATLSDPSTQFGLWLGVSATAVSLLYAFCAPRWSRP